MGTKTTPSKSTFAVYLGNRGFFPASLLMAAREELTQVLSANGYGVRMMDPAATRHGAVETVAEGRRFAEWLERQRGEIDGVIVSLPNFGDETGAVTALRDAGVPILIQAYPDELDKMDQARRRDAFCGKFSIMDMFCQYGIRFTALTPHTVAPRSERFLEHLDQFDRICRVVQGMRRLTVGAIGARTTAFKTVRIDELTLQKAGITTETLDLSMIIRRVRDLTVDDAYRRTRERLWRPAAGRAFPTPAWTTWCACAWSSTRSSPNTLSTLWPCVAGSSWSNSSTSLPAWCWGT